VVFDLQPFWKVADLLYQGPWVAERLAALGSFIRAHPNATHPIVEQIVMGASKYSAADAFSASYELARLRRIIEPIWQSVDAIVLPTVPTHYTLQAVLADPIQLNRNLGTYTNFANLLDLCAVAVPAGLRRSGLPFGVTWFAPADHDRRLLDMLRTRKREHAEPLAGRIRLAVAGAHLSGQPLNSQLTRLGARLVSQTTTAAEYRLYVLDTEPAKPGLVHTPDSAGHCIEVEIWELDATSFGSFVNQVPAPMTIGTTKLVDGSRVKGFCCEPHALKLARDISEYGGWRQYLARDASASADGGRGESVFPSPATR
jgi:allophanate hydrolase